MDNCNHVNKRARLNSDAASSSQSQKSQSQQQQTEGRLWMVEQTLLHRLHAHQKDAVAFVLSRLIFDTEDQSVTNPCLDQGHSGAILADDMGTGKTLVALTSAWAICKQMSCKGVIVTPTTLVKNWMAETIKWFPSTLATSMLFISGSSSKSSKAMDAEVHRFVTSHASVHPLLVVSYEMFRVYAPAFNTMNNLELLICDEGHRIKNASGTKTTLALGNCVAMRRLLLTGTPLQNRLDELFAVVHFVAPGYLDSLKDFQRDFIDVIDRGKLSDASLRAKEQAASAEQELKRRLAPLMLRRTKQAVMARLLPACSRWLVGLPMSPQERTQYQQLAQQITESTAERVDMQGKMLAVLQSARVQCSSSSSSSAGPCSKLQACTLLLEVALTQGEKVVVVSNFSSTLDAMRCVARQKGWGCLRIDGNVSADKRLKIADIFNSSAQAFPVLLLSTRAGGVGLNLTGASRLILLEPDWNPSTDQQAMARIWREGQRKESSVYRLFLQGTVEEAILLRQREKGELARVITEDGGEDGEAVEVQGEVLKALVSEHSLHGLLHPEQQAVAAADSADAEAGSDPVLRQLLLAYVGQEQQLRIAREDVKVL